MDIGSDAFAIFVVAATKIVNGEGHGFAGIAALHPCFREETLGLWVSNPIDVADQRSRRISLLSPIRRFLGLMGVSE